MRWYRKKDLCNKFRVAKATIDRWCSDKPVKTTKGLIYYTHLGFPKPRKLEGTTITYWDADEVDAWVPPRRSKTPVTA